MAHSTCVGSRALRGPRQGCEVSSLGGRGAGGKIHETVTTGGVP